MLTFILLAAISASGAPKIRILPSLVRNYYVEPAAISDDGRIVVGYGEDENFLPRAIWQQKGGRLREVLPSLPGSSTATDVSADGLVIVGVAQSTAGFGRGFYWHRQEGFVELGANPDLASEVTGVSGDGRIAIGTSYDYANPSPNRAAFRWSAGHGFEPLDDMGGTSTSPEAANHTGSVIVGSVQVISGPSRACRWLTNGVGQLLGDLGGNESNAYDVSPDGTVIVGIARLADGSRRAFHWTLQTGMQQIDVNGDYNYSVAKGVAANGRIVGYAYYSQPHDPSGNLQTALIWTPEAGQQELNQAYPKALPRGWYFLSADAISADGRWITGMVGTTRRGARAFVLDTGAKK